MKLLLLIISICVFDVVLAQEPIVKKDEVILIQRMDLESGVEYNWLFKVEELKKKSSWAESLPLPLSIVDALKIARHKVPKSPLLYVELRRPLDECKDVFFYYISFEGESVVVLLDGQVVNPLKHKLER